MKFSCFLLALLSVGLTQANARFSKPALADTSTETGPYCGCEMNGFGEPANWQSRDIWLDVVIVLDCSEALSSESLQQAAKFIEELLGDVHAPRLTTDITAAYYTRVGVIAMTDAPEVLYNLNMTAKDTVTDRVTIKKGVAEIDLNSAFLAAQSMLADGLVSEPVRASTRQVVHFLTDSQPKDMAAINEFKTSGGIVIVNNVLSTGEQPKSSLKSLASEGYFYDEVDDYWTNVQALCKANCFCASHLVPYAGGDPALQAAGGCYVSPVNPVKGLAFSQAKHQCSEDFRQGIIATVHDSNKGAFLNKLISDVVPKKSFFWIGYEKSDFGIWRWEDESNDPYKNWGRDEPSSAPVSKCAYVDQSSSSLTWGAGNCNNVFRYACEYAACSVGNKYC